MSGDVSETLIWLAMFAPVMAISLFVRYRNKKRDVELAAERDEAD